jgi:hypothetical protein
MRFISSLLTAATVSVAMLTPLAAHAVGKDETSPTGKGIVGGALLGAEAVLLVEAAFDVEPTWAYIVGGVAGGIGGGIGGYFVEQDGDARIPMLMLAGGMALAIPTTVAVLSATAYEPPADYVQDRAPADEPVAEPPRPESSPLPATQPTSPTTAPGSTTPSDAPPATEPAPTPAPSGRAPAKRNGRYSELKRKRLPDLRLPPPALIGVSPRALSLSIPAVEIRTLYTRKEVAMYGVEQATEVRVPVINFVF